MCLYSMFKYNFKHFISSFLILNVTLSHYQLNAKVLNVFTIYKQKRTCEDKALSFISVLFKITLKFYNE